MSSASEYYASGLNAFRMSSYETAFDLFTLAIEKAQKAQYYDARSKCAEKLGRLNDALSDVRHSLRIDPTATRCYIRGAQLWERAGKPESALKLLKIASCKVSPADSKVIEEHATRLEEKAAARQLAPFANLPFELFSTIVHYLIEDEWTRLIDTGRGPERPVVIMLSHVCRQWRDIILREPSFWRKLSLTGKEKDKATTQTKTFTERSMLSLTHLHTLASAQAPLEHILSASKIFGAFAKVTSLSLVGGCVHDMRPPRANCLPFLYQRTLRATLTHLKVVFPECTRFSLTEALYETWDLFPALKCAEFATVRMCDQAALTPFHDSRLVEVQRDTTLLWNRPFTASPGAGNSIVIPYAPPKEPRQLESLVIRGAVASSQSFMYATQPEPTVIFPKLKSLCLGSTMAQDHLGRLRTAGQLESFEFENPTSSPGAHGQMPVLTEELFFWARLKRFKWIGRPHCRQIVRNMVDEQVSLSSMREFTGDLYLLPDLMPLFNHANAPCLTTLDLSKSVATDQKAIPMPDDLRNLETLRLASCDWVTDSHVRALKASAPRLIEIDLSNNARISAGPIVDYVKFREPPSLQQSEVANAQPQGRYSLVEQLNLEGCQQLEEVAIHWLRKNIRPNGLKFAFYDAASEKKLFRLGSRYMP